MFQAFLQCCLTCVRWRLWWPRGTSIRACALLACRYAPVPPLWTWMASQTTTSVHSVPLNLLPSELARILHIVSEIVPSPLLQRGQFSLNWPVGLPVLQSPYYYMVGVTTTFTQAQMTDPEFKGWLKLMISCLQRCSPCQKEQLVQVHHALVHQLTRAVNNCNLYLLHTRNGYAAHIVNTNSRDKVMCLLF